MLDKLIEEAGRVMRGALGLALLFLVALACGPSNLPDDQLLSSPHFRYHARADEVLDPTIMDRLEFHRSELDGYLDVDSGVIDYYRFRDLADRQANVPCGGECTDGRSVFAIIPVHEHELVHALLADVNQPAPVVAEGTAQYFSCLWPKMARATAPAAWPGIGSTSIFTIDDPEIVYPFGQRLVSWMAQTGGTRKLVDFYRGTLLTSDAAVFALQFERFWSRRLSDVAGELLDQRYAGSFCPCTAPAVPLDGSSTSFVAGEDYRTLDIEQESRLELSTDGPLPAFPFACANGIIDRSDSPDLAARFFGAETALTVARIGPGRYGVTADSFYETVTVRQTQQATNDWTCASAAAHPIALGRRSVTAWITPDVADENDETWFAFDVDGLTGLQLLSPTTDLAICPSCDPGCGFGAGGGERIPDPISVMPPATGPLLIKVRKVPNQPATNLGFRVQRWQ